MTEQSAARPRRTHEPPDRAERFTAVAETVWIPLHRYLRRRADPDDVDDIATDTLTVMWRRLDDIPAGVEVPWCYSIARRCLANHRRSAVRRRGLTDRLRGRHHGDGTSVDDATSHDPGTNFDALDHELHSALSELSSDDRELLRLWAWEQLDVGEIAVALDATPNTISVRLRRARQRLAARLEHHPAADRSAHECHIEADAGHENTGSTQEPPR
jgi:RNA polymerase sigma factor (sigma-70 family)